MAGIYPTQMDTGPFYITQPNPTAFRPNPTHDALARTQPDSPTTPNPWKGDIFQINVANSKIQNRPRWYISYNMNILAQTATLTATAITLIKFTWLSLSNPTQPNPTPGWTNMPISGGVYKRAWKPFIHSFVLFCRISWQTQITTR